MSWAKGQCSKDEKVQSALWKVNTLGRHRYPFRFYKENNTTSPVEVQGKIPIANGAIILDERVIAKSLVDPKMCHMIS